MKLKLTIAIILLAIAGFACWLAWALMTPYGSFPAEGVVLEIPRGTSRRGVARRLAQNGVIRNALAFELLARWRSRTELQAGEYQFTGQAPAMEVFRKIAEGRVFFHPLVIPEGLNMFEIADRVEQAGFASRADFLAVARDSQPIRDVAPQAQSLEGFLFPATYGFPRSVTAREIAQAMVSRFRQEWGAFSEPGRNPHELSPLELVTVASLVEKETGQADERPMIAGVFYNRLAKRVALQCDPTVLYAMELAGKNDGVINQSDLRLDSQYNTYRNRGLPPGPIANPGPDALRAALFPPQTDYLYFVADTHGGHFFSRTLNEHLASVARYRNLAGLSPQSAAKNGAPKPPSKKTAPKPSSKQSPRRGP
jgi:UPF0755 protein